MKYLIGKYFKDNSLKYPMYKVLDTDTLEVTVYMHDELLRKMGRECNLVLKNITKKALSDNKVRNFSFDYEDDLTRVLNSEWCHSSKFAVSIQGIVENIPVEYKSPKYSIFMYRKKTALFKDIVLFFHEKLYMFHLSRHIFSRDTAEIYLPITVNGDKEVVVRQFDGVLYGYDSMEDTFKIFFCSVLSPIYVEGFGVTIHKDGLVEFIDGDVIDTYQNNEDYDEVDFKTAVLSVKRMQISD